jgi:signal transduction histidine kinase
MQFQRNCHPHLQMGMQDARTGAVIGYTHRDFWHMTFGAGCGYDGGMNVFFGQRRRWTSVSDFLGTVWPRSLATDSGSQRRKKYAARSAQLAVVVLVAWVVTGTIVSPPRQLPILRAVPLALAGLAYIVWSLCLMQDVVRASLWERGAGPQPAWPPRSQSARAFGFAVEVGLAGLICCLGGSAEGYKLLVWVVLTVPVVLGGFLLRAQGTALVSGLCAALLTITVAGWHGWNAVPDTLLAFSFLMLFTVVLTLPTVTSERARGEVERLAGELGEANRKLREYAVQAEELAATRERNRVAREIHDSLGHYLTVVNVQLEAGRAMLERDPARARAALEKAQALTQDGLEGIRRSVAALRAPPLDNQGLAEALRQVVDESRAAGMAVEIQVLGEMRRVSPPVELTLFRAGQEGLTNVRKHARATHVWLTLDFRAPARVGMTVSDDGSGAPMSADPAAGFGLLGLRERAQLLGGDVRVRTAPGKGFTLEVEVPG